MSVLPPRTARPFLTFVSADSFIAAQSMPPWPKNFWSSELITAWISERETRARGSQVWAVLAVFFFAFASRSLWRMSAVGPGFFAVRARSSPRGGRPMST